MVQVCRFKAQLIYTNNPSRWVKARHGLKCDHSITRQPSPYIPCHPCHPGPRTPWPANIRQPFPYTLCHPSPQTPRPPNTVFVNFHHIHYMPPLPLKHRDSNRYSPSHTSFAIPTPKHLCVLVDNTCAPAHTHGKATAQATSGIIHKRKNIPVINSDNEPMWCTSMLGTAANA